MTAASTLLTTVVNTAVNPFQAKVTAAMEEIKATVNNLNNQLTTSTAAIDLMDHKVLDMVDTIKRTVDSSYGHITRTTLPEMNDRTAPVVDRTVNVADRTTALATRLDALKERITAHQNPSTAQTPPKTN